MLKSIKRNLQEVIQASKSVNQNTQQVAIPLFFVDHFVHFIKKLIDLREEKKGGHVMRD